MRTRNKYVLVIAGLTIEFQTELKIELIDSFIPFLSEEKQNCPDYMVEFSEVSELKFSLDNRKYESLSYIIASDEENGFYRIFRDARRNGWIYAVARYDWKRKSIFVEYLSEGLEFVKEIGSCFFHIAWEAILMHEQRMMLHSACVETMFGGILFCGPSGIGKSTQAELWCKYKNGRLLNGDRTIIHLENEKWMAYGSPYAGSSRCYVNKSCMIYTIVILKQGKQCQLRRLGTAEGFHKIFPCLTMNTWDEEFVSFACDFAEALASQIPVYELVCTPNENAVKILESELRKR